jgi:hypothetical protein
MGPNGFDDLHDPAPPVAGTDTLAAVATRARVIRRRRSALAGAGAVGVIALVVGAIVALGGPADRIAPADETPVSTAVTPETTNAPSSDPTVPASTSVVPTTQVAGDDPCLDRPGPPPWLLDGTSPGEATIVETADGSVSARWGDEGSTAAVTQVRTDPAADWFGIVEGTDQLVISASARAAVVPVGDGAIGMIRVAVSDESCDREYVVGPGVELDEAIAFAQDWVDALAAWDSLTTSDGALDRCVTAGSSATSACVTTDLAGTGSSATAELTDTSLLLVLVVGPEGTAFEAPSSLARSERLPGSSNVVLTDVIRRSSCGGVDFPDAPGSPLGTACPEAPEPFPAGITWSDVAAVDGDGDVVVFDAAGQPTAVYDGTDPDDPLPAEGEVTFVDGATFAPDGSGVLVGLCCEPVPGSVLSVDPSSGAVENVAFGRLPAATRYGNVVWATLGVPGGADPAVVVGDADGSIAMTLQSFPLDSRIVDLAVVPDTTMPGDVGDLVLVLLATPDGVELRRFYAAGGDMMLTARISDVPGTEDAGLSLAGWGGGTIAVLDRANDVLRSFDVETFSPIPALDRTGEGWISAWFTPGTARFVTADRRLVVDEVEVPGEYVWVR